MITNEFLQVQKALEKLPTVIAQKVVVGATRAAAKVIADEAKQNVRQVSGNSRRESSRSDESVRKCFRGTLRPGIWTGIPRLRYLHPLLW